MTNELENPRYNVKTESNVVGFRVGAVEISCIIAHAVKKWSIECLEMTCC
jgi:hypothetical protein